MSRYDDNPDLAREKGKKDGRAQKKLGIVSDFMLHTAYDPPRDEAAKEAYDDGFEQGKKR